MALCHPEFGTKNSLVPYSESDTDHSSDEIEEETFVGKRGYKKPKTLPKMLQNMIIRDTSIQPNPCANKKCQNSCGEKVSESDRILINEQFWSIGNKNRQRDWLVSCIKRKCVNRRRSDSNTKKYTYDCVINSNDNSLKVCQQFLLKTLRISQKMLINARDNSKYLKSYSTNKKRSTPHNKSDESKVALIKAFIEQLPAVPSHYFRNKSNKLYLPQEFRNIKGLYESYTEHLKSINMKSAQLSLAVFRNIFKNSFHIGFHLPKKDKCITCENYNNLSSEAQTILELTENYQNHMRDKNKSKEIFLEEQKQSKTNSSLLCASFDLQKVLNTPHGKAVTLFYSRKYAYYNESVYENSTRNGCCFLWGEADGKRGCNEICTVLFQYLKLADERRTHFSISLYCDSCAGQNRNRAMLVMLMVFLQNSNFITNIKITFLLPGHTMMPVDSIHSTIESFIRNRTIWAPSEWSTMISNARTNPAGYQCIAMDHCDFKDWKTFSQAMIPNSIKISFPALRSASFEKNSSIIKLKYGYFDNSEIKEVDLSSIARTRRNSSIVADGVLPLYKNMLKISSKKYKDLKALCDKNTIPKKYHNEFFNMIYEETVKDALPETDEDDNS